MDAERIYQITQDLIAKRVSRRVFLNQATALGISGSLASSILSNAAIAETPRQGGHLLIGMSDASANASLDPATYNSWYVMLCGAQFYDRLVEIDEQGLPQPSLAESWEPRDGAKVWVFKLRKGVTFSNGKNLTASDVVYTFNHHRQRRSQSASLLSRVVDINATDTLEVTFTLSSGIADMPYIVADFRFLIGPEGTNFTDTIGTGPFLAESVQMGVRVVLRRNPTYWRSGQPHVDSVEILGINDSTARLSALLSGRVHLIDSIPPKTVKLLAGKEQFKVYELRGTAQYYMPMRCDTAPFDNADVRLALKYAIDRQTMLEKILSGHGAIGNDIPVPSFDQFFAADIPQRNYDPDRAKFHLKKSGYGGSFILSTSEAPFSGAVDAAVVYSASAEKAGITIQVDRQPADGYWDNVWSKKPWCVSSWNGRPTVDITLTTLLQSDAPSNDSFWKRPEFDKLLSEARSELNIARRKQMYLDLQMMIYEDGGIILPLFPHWIEAASTKVHGYYQIPTLFMSGQRAPERVWLES